MRPSRLQELFHVFYVVYLNNLQCTHFKRSTCIYPFLCRLCMGIKGHPCIQSFPATYYCREYRTCIENLIPTPLGCQAL